MLIKSQLYALQLLEYDPIRFLKWVLRNPFKFNIEKKNRLVLTNKAKTLIYLSTLLTATITISGFMKSLILSLAALTAYLTVPFIYLTLALFIIKLYEMPNRVKTIKEARKLISKNPNLLVIGITGSYGKTTIKEILKTILSKKYKVLSTPKSFNTLFGISTIIKEQLKPDHEIFIVEMGAYKKGEIAELCRMVKPKIGILGGITNQHLERFGSLENIVKAKYELVEALPQEGLAVFNLDSKYCQELFRKTSVNKIGYSLQTNQESNILAMITEATTLNTKFRLFSQSSVQESKIEDFILNLSGEHNVSNALAAIAVALHLGIPSDDIKQALSEVKSPAHRLQVVNNPDGTVIIDDAYSSNVEGTKAAVNLVTKFVNKPKIIVTPGLVELGKMQFEENKKIGEAIASNFDYAIIVNKTNRQSLLEGILGSENPKWFLTKTEDTSQGTLRKEPNRIFVADSLEEATKSIIPTLVKPGSLILFENDLPDIYE